MTVKSFLAHSPTGLFRLFLRLPILLYRLKLGWLLGHRFVLLNHIGRKSGQLRQTVVEVIEYDKETGRTYIASGWGYKSNWYQNLLAHPSLHIQLGWHRMKVLAQPLSPEESVSILLDYRQKHPFAARELSRFIGLEIIKTTPAEIKEYVQKSLPMIVLIKQDS
jgi:deazaflavin-dependent oxidoreductase (nitroreductase family)